MAKTIAQYVAEGVENPQTQQGLDIMAEDAANKARQTELRKRGEEEGLKPEGRTSFDIPSAPVKMPTRPGQQPMVTMDMIKAKGFDNLRDYLNDQKGLVRRREKPAAKSYENRVKFDPAAYSTHPLEVSSEKTRRQQKAAAPAPKEETPKPRARSLVDQGRGVQLYKDVDTEAVLAAGLGLAALYPAVRGAKMAYTAARPAISAAIKRLEDRPLPSFLDDRPGPMKKGGVVKKMAPGGKVSSASSRGDGIAQRGKTKGRMC